VIAAANPLRGVASDAASIRALMNTIEGPIIPVGHSYGGNVISEAATGASQVKALVYRAAYRQGPGKVVMLSVLGGSE
jgi:pimeloyl-ACP methyl ester carboxylesterase